MHRRSCLSKIYRINIAAEVGDRTGHVADVPIVRNYSLVLETPLAGIISRCQTFNFSIVSVPRLNCTLDSAGNHILTCCTAMLRSCSSTVAVLRGGVVELGARGLVGVPMRAVGQLEAHLR